MIDKEVLGGQVVIDKKVVGWEVVIDKEFLERGTDERYYGGR